MPIVREMYTAAMQATETALTILEAVEAGNFDLETAKNKLRDQINLMAIHGNAQPTIIDQIKTNVAPYQDLMKQPRFWEFTAAAHAARRLKKYGGTLPETDPINPFWEKPQE